MAELVIKIMTAAPVPLASVCPSAPLGLEDVILKCLAKDRKDRHQSVADLALALRVFAPRRSKASVARIARIQHRGNPGESTQLPPSSDEVTQVSTSGDPSTIASWGRTNPPPNKRRHVLIGVGTLATAVAVWAAFGRSTRTPSAMASAASPVVANAPSQTDAPQLVEPGLPAPVAATSAAPAETANQAPTSTATGNRTATPLKEENARKPVSATTSIAPLPAPRATQSARNPLRMQLE